MAGNFGSFFGRVQNFLRTTKTFITKIINVVWIAIKESVKEIPVLPRHFDYILIHRVAGVPVNRDELKAFFDKTDFHAHIYGREGFDILKHYGELFGIIDQKAATLLTHISLMIAATAILMNEADTICLKSGLSALLFFYTVCAVLALRITRFWIDSFPKATEFNGHWLVAELDHALKPQMAESFYEELAFRSIIHKKLTNLVSVATLTGAVILAMTQIVVFLVG